MEKQKKSKQTIVAMRIIKNAIKQAQHMPSIHGASTFKAFFEEE